MIPFHGDQLVPPELPRLLYLTVPEELHVPVVFHNRPSFYVPPNALGVCTGDQIHIDLNHIYDDAQRRGGSISVWTWKLLLDVCYHEFGHVATWGDIQAMRGTYRTDRVRLWGESLAEGWKNVRISVLLDHDVRLAQPKLIKGYLGLRIAKLMDRFRGFRGAVGAVLLYAKEVRSHQTGGQLFAGDVLKCLGMPPDAYRELRRVSEDVGIDYWDSAWRLHKLYTWGDLPVLNARLKGARQRLWKKHRWKVVRLWEPDSVEI